MKPALPPYARFLGVMADRAADGTPLFRMPFGQGNVGRPGFLHGGAISGLLELAAIGTLLHALEDEAAIRVKPVTITVDFLRGGLMQETFAAAVINRLGKRIANVEAVAWQDDRTKPIATARMNLMLRRDG